MLFHRWPPVYVVHLLASHAVVLYIFWSFLCWPHREVTGFPVPVCGNKSPSTHLALSCTVTTKHPFCSLFIIDSVIVNNPLNDACCCYSVYCTALHTFHWLLKFIRRNISPTFSMEVMYEINTDTKMENFTLFSVTLRITGFFGLCPSCSILENTKEH
jgi:hypothetical protein